MTPQAQRSPEEARAEAPSRSAIEAALDGELREVEEHMVGRTPPYRFVSGESKP
jgi:hypothetical protein